MKKLKFWAWLSLALALLALASLLFMHFALTDISHGEQDTNLEWTILRLGFLVIGFLVVATFILTGLLFKSFRAHDDKEEPRPKD